MEALGNFSHIIHSQIQDNAGGRTFLTLFKKDRFLDLMIVDFENSASYKYLVQKSRFFQWFDQKWLSIHFLFLSRIDVKSVSKISVTNFCRLTPQTHPGHGSCVASLNLNCVWFVDPIFPESKSKVLMKLCIKLLTLVWNYSLCSQSFLTSP